MGKIKITIVMLSILLLSCESQTDLERIFAKCKGRAVVVAKGYSNGNIGTGKYYMLIRDDSLNVYEYIGRNYNAKVGDTLK